MDIAFALYVRTHPDRTFHIFRAKEYDHRSEESWMIELFCEMSVGNYQFLQHVGISYRGYISLKAVFILQLLKLVTA